MKESSLLVSCTYVIMLLRTVEPKFASFSNNPQNLPEIKIRQGKQLGSGESLVEIPCNYMVKIDLGVSVSLKSPRYPRNYPVRTYCLRTIVASNTANRLFFSCSLFELEEESPTCITSDFIRIWEFEPLNSKYFCGSNTLPSLTSKGSVMNIGFFSNVAYTFSGFVCSVTAVENDVESVPKSFQSVSLLSNSCQCGERKLTSSSTKSGSWKVDPTLEYPWMCAIKVETSLQTPQICGGTLINSRFLVSSASCLINKGKEDLEVILGPQNLSIKYESELTPKEKVLNIILHPDFNVTNFENNIALVELSGHVKFTTNSGIHPICLPSSNLLNAFQNEGFIAGWKSYPWAPEVEDVPQKSVVTIVTADVCSALTEDFIVLDTMVCGINVKSGTCQSDDGGPLMVYSDGKIELFGVASFVKDCRNNSTPAIFTKVSDYLPWIQEVISDESSC